jgi:hypothetical protein
MKVPSSVFQLLHGIGSALNNHSIPLFRKHGFANTGIDFSITEV